MKNFISFMLVLFVYFSNVGADEHEDKTKHHDWLRDYPRYVNWEDRLHPLRVLPVATHRLKGSVEHLQNKDFFAINTDEAKWFLANDNFNPSDILAKVVLDYENEVKKEKQNAIVLRATNNDHAALRAEHSAITSKRKAESINKMMFKPKLFLVRGLISAPEYFHKDKYHLFTHDDHNGIWLDYRCDKPKTDGLKTLPVVLIMAEEFSNLYVSVSSE